MVTSTSKASINSLELHRVRKDYARVAAVDDVSLMVAPGEFITLLGPSGCGKTTLLRMIAGFITPTSGEIRIGGVTVNAVPAYKRSIGIVFQGLALFPHMTVEDNIAFGLRVVKTPEPEVSRLVAEALELIGLPGLGTRRIHEISGGQRQRVALVRSLVLKPDVLLLDEPLGALDLKIRQQLQIELKKIQKQVGTTFVFVTHDQDEALKMSDRIAVMNLGRIEQLGKPEDIYNRPSTPFVAKFVGETNFFNGIVVAHPATDRAIEIPELGVVVAAECGQLAPGAAVSVSVRPENVRLVAPDASKPGQLTGVIKTSIYAGQHIRYVVGIHGADLIVMQPAALSQVRRLDVDDPVGVEWSPLDAFVQATHSSKEREHL